MYRHCLLLTCLVASLPAQTSIHPRTDGATLTFAIDGPTRFGQRMAKTKLYAMTQSKQFQELWAPLQAKLDEAMEANKDEMPIEPKVLMERMLAYGGRVHGAFWMDLKDLESEEPRGWGYVIAEPDGSTDLVAMCKELEKLALEDKDARSRQVQLGGGEWLVGGEDAMWVSLPRMVGDRAVMLVGGEANQTELAGLFDAGKEPAKATPEAGSPPAMHASFDAGWLMDAVAQQMEASGQAPFDVKDLLKALGAEGLGRIEFRIREEGQHVDLSFEVEVAGEPRGMRAMMYPDSNKAPALLGLVPRQSATFGAIPMVVRELEPMIKEIMKLLPQEMTWDDVEAMVEAQVGVRLGQDVLAHFGDELLWIGTPPKPKDPDADEEDPMAEAMAAFDGISFGLALRDGTALNRSLETILDRSGVLRMRKSEKYRDVDVHRITLPIVDQKLHWVITDKLMFVGIGDGGVKNLQNVLDEASARARGEAPAAFAPGITKRLDVVEPGYSSVSVAEIGWLLDALLSGITEDDEFEGDIDDLRDAFAKLQDLLRSSDLSHMLTVQYSRPGRIVQRTIW